MADRTTISQVIESLFEDWIDRNINVHPLAIENMRILEADALALLKEQEAVEPFSDDDGGYWCSSCHEDIVWHQKFCSNCGKPVLWKGR